MSPDDRTRRICEKWSHFADLDRIEAQLRRRGVDPAAPTPADLEMLDQLHSGQLQATREFCAWVDPGPGDRVLDLGAGLGGSARHLAGAHDCRVIALELSPALHATGEELTRRTGLQDRVTHCCRDLRTLDAAAEFDLVWLQHVDMHMPDKAALYAAARAALVPGGRVVWHDWLAGPGGAPRYPLPWSADGTLSHLIPEPEFRAALDAAGLRLTRLTPRPAETRAWFAAGRDNLRRVLARPEAADRAHLETLLAGSEGVLINLDEARLLPIFAAARPAEEN